MRLLALVALGGALGSSLRYLVALGFAAAVGAGFPWATLTVNVLGSFLIGLVTALGLELGRLPDEVRLFLTTGVMGGLTTYSTFSLDAVRLLESGDALRGAGYLVLTTVACLLSCAGGLALARQLG